MQIWSATTINCGIRVMCLQWLNWGLYPLFSIIYKSLDIHYSVLIFVLFFSCCLSVCLSCQVVELTKSLICLSYYRLSNCLFHQVNLTLSYQLHVSVCKRYQHFLCLVRCSSITSARHSSHLFCWRKYEERIRFHTKVEVFSERWAYQELNISLDFE